jgi:O-antigen/teichoic acid export membrane protein
MGGFKEIVKHGGNYLTANLATKALAFISIPVYTRLLSADEYGIISIFIGVIAILGSVMSFSADRSVSRFYFDQKGPEDFKQFVSTSSFLAGIFFLINTVILIVFAEEFGELVGLSKRVVYLLIPVTFINIIGLTFEQIYGPIKKSKTIALSSLARVYLGFAFSITFIFIFKDNRYYGQIIGQIFAGILMIIYWVKKIKPYFKFSFNIKYVKYIFTYSIPLIPYALSGVIIAQFGKIAIGSDQGLAEAGFYSLAATLGGLVSIIISVTHQAWNPYYMEYMNSKNYLQIDIDFNKIFKITILSAFVISAFGKEIGLLIAKEDFVGSLYLIPIFTMGYIFYQFAYVYLRNFGYSKKTHYMTITVFISGLSNVLMNIIFIDKYGELGAAISFALSYVVMAVVAWFFNSFFVKLHSPNLKPIFLAILLVIPFYFFLYKLIIFESILISIFIKLFLVAILSLLLFWKEKNEIIKAIKSF